MDDDSALERDGGIAIVLTTVPDAGVGEELVQRLLTERLIACGNLVPGLLSLYRWEGAIAREAEVLVLLKADAASVDRLFGRIAELHPYAVPELVQLPVSGVSRAYARWVMQSTGVIE